MELFEEHGYARTTVGDIAARAALTERTFFRYFTDKREVLFSGSQALERAIVESVTGAPQDAAPLEVVTGAFERAATALQAHGDMHYVRMRHALVVEHAELRERELIKLASMAAAVTEALRARGVGEPTASLVGEAGIAVFKVGFERWVSGKKPQSFAAHVRSAMDGLKAVTAGVTASSPTRPRKAVAAGRKSR
jgi:AcrR family transcriptional regulator